MGDADLVKVAAQALREVRDLNKARRGMFCTKTQEICRAALKEIGDRDG